MKGYHSSFAGMFQNHPSGAPSIKRVEIPLIQRDYAQGRPGETVEEIRSRFLEVLLDSVAGGEPVGLDFIYGKVSHGTLHPLDGQQRLTTLFLLHWYLASAADQLVPGAPWTRFSYATRPSARLFSERLAAHPLPHHVNVPSTWVTDQEWYLHVWKHDPTIKSMLVVIDSIHTELDRKHPGLDPAAAWRLLTDEHSPAISFQLLPLDDMSSEEDLYIKMNSRGKPLTPFENFKARFEQDIHHSDRAGEFAHKIDGAWSDLLWPYHGGDNIVDDEFMRYIDFVTEICELRQHAPATPGRLGQRARAVFGPDNPRAHEHLDFLFDAFDQWMDADHIADTFDELLSTALPGDDTYDPRKVTLFGAKSTNLFQQCCSAFDSQADRNRAFTLQQSLLLYAVLLHLISRSEDFPRRLRVLRNLVAASEDEIRRPNMPALLADVEQIIVLGDLDSATTFSANQIEDERLKAEFLEARPDLTEPVFRLEDHPILRGTLSSFDFDHQAFRQRAEAFEEAFSNPANWASLTGALLATGDYQRQPPRSIAWQFGTSSPKNEAVWRYLLTDAPRESLTSTRIVLAEFLDGLHAAQDTVAGYAQGLIRTWLSLREQQNAFDWRYYLIKYPSMRSGATGIYYGVDGELGYSMCMLRTKQRNGLYRDPVLLQIWESSGVGDKAEDPWFTGYETTPRWLRLARSGAGVRSVAGGLALGRPEGQDQAADFDRICAGRHDIDRNDRELLLRIPQRDAGAGAFDTINRIEVGAALLAELAEAGL